jgi:hypothetical protein
MSAFNTAMPGRAADFTRFQKFSLYWGSLLSPSIILQLARTSAYHEVMLSFFPERYRPVSTDACLTFTDQSLKCPGMDAPLVADSKRGQLPGATPTPNRDPIDL